MAVKYLDQLKSLKAAKEQLALTLGDSGQPVPPAALASKEFADSTETTFGTNTLTLKASARGEIGLFRNAPKEEEDPDGILRAPGKGGTGDHAAPPILDKTVNDHATLKYSIEGDLAEAITIPLAGAGALGFNASQTLRFCDYRAHLKTKELGQAIEDDLRNPRLALTLKDVSALEPGHALSLSLTGSLSASVKLSWAGVFTTAPGLLAEILENGSGTGIRVDSGLAVTATVFAEDDFRATFACAGGGLLRVALSKAKTRKVDLAARLAVSAKVDLSEADLDLLISGLYGSGKGPAGAAARTALRDKLVALAKNTIEAGFTYEYSRVSTGKVLFQGTLDKAALTAEIHGAALRGDIPTLLLHEPRSAEILGLPAVTPVITLEHYLHQTKRKEERCWGFSLGIGKWKLFGEDDVEFTAETSEDIEKHVKLAYAGGWTYQSNGRAWTTDYKADMERFSPILPPGGPRVSEFQWGFHLSRSYSQRVDEAVRGKWLDWALLWRVIDNPQVAKLADDLAKLDGAHVDATFQILLHHDEVNAILDHKGEFPCFSSALASAMPWVKDVEERAGANARLARYRQTWEWYLDDEPAARLTPDLGAKVGQWFQGSPRASDACIALERSHPPAESFAEIAASIDGGAKQGDGRTLRARIADFKSGLALLRDNLDASHDPVIPTAFKSMMGMGSQHFLMRALGVYLLDRAREAGALPHVIRSLTVKPEGAGGKTLVYGNGKEKKG